MKRIAILAGMVLLLVCGCAQKGLERRAAVLGRHVPDVERLERSKGFLTEEYYAMLEEMVGLPDYAPVLHEWEFWFVAADGSPVAACAGKVDSLVKLDDAHAEAVMLVQPADSDYVAERHKLLMEKVEGKWLLADYDDTREACARYLESRRREQVERDAIGEYLVKEIGKHYLQGEVCIPVIRIVSEEEVSEAESRVWGDFWVDWYKVAGDTLKTVSGGNHSGCMTLRRQGDAVSVAGFEQTVDGAGNEPSARRIFGNHFDIYQAIHSNDDSRQQARKAAIRAYRDSHDLAVKFFQDYGWPAEPVDE